MNAIGEFTSPREKLECLLNCCRIINCNVLLYFTKNYLNNWKNIIIIIDNCFLTLKKVQITSMGNIANADELLPRLILLIIHTNPPQLSSSLKYFFSFFPTFFTL